jgi:hypothetical protein
MRIPRLLVAVAIVPMALGACSTSASSPIATGSLDRAAAASADALSG